MHSSLLIFNELMRISSSDCEKIRVEVLGILQDQSTRTVVGSNPVEFLIEQVYPNLIESRTAKDLTEKHHAVVVFF